MELLRDDIENKIDKKIFIKIDTGKTIKLNELFFIVSWYYKQMLVIHIKKLGQLVKDYFL